MTGSASRAAVRVARRDAWRHRRRSLLIVAMIAIPVMGASAVDVLARTAQLSPQQEATRSIGRADATVSAVARGPITQTPLGYSTGPSQRAGEASTLTVAQLRALLPAGTRTVVSPRGHTRLVSRGERSAVGDVVNFNYADPLVAGMYTQHSGRAPSAPGEGAVSTQLAHDLGARVGDSVTVRVGTTEQPIRVVGIVSSTLTTSGEQMFTLPNAATYASTVQPAELFVGFPPHTDVAALQRSLNRHGVELSLRSSYARGTSLSEFQRTYHAGIVLVVVGLAAFEVVLLAGAAFAVGARRARRELALIATTGASPPHIGAVVLAQGLVLGLCGGVLGALLGVPAGVIARAPIQHHVGTLFGPLDIRPLEIAGIALVGVVTGVLAAALPAWGATRLRVVDCLNGRRGTVRTSRALTALGLVLVAVGIATAAYGARTRLTGGAFSAGNGSVDLPTPVLHLDVILVGALMAEIGLVACVPALVGLAGHLGRLLPAAARIGLRDVTRNRSRSAPAIAAIMAALAGAIAVSTYLVSSDAYQRQTFTSTVLPGQAMLSTAVSPAKVAAIAAQLPTRAVATIDQAEPRCGRKGGCDSVSIRLPVAQRCPAPTDRQVSAGEVRRLAHDPRCNAAGLPSMVAVGGADVVSVALRHDDAGAQAALARGEAVALQPAYVEHGTVDLLVPDASGRLHSLVIPVHTVRAQPASGLPAVVLPPHLAASLNLRPRFVFMVFDTTRMPTTTEISRAQALLDFGALDVLFVDQGFHPVRSLDLIAIVAVAAFVTIAAVAVATTLAIAEGEPDLATLGAVGASPRTRRVVAGMQAASVGVLGAALGLVAGVVPAWALVHAQLLWTLHLPWRLFVVALVGVPLLCALLAAAFSRSRLPMRARAT